VESGRRLYFHKLDQLLHVDQTQWTIENAGVINQGGQGYSAVMNNAAA
jgi:hypothetical protein